MTKMNKGFTQKATGKASSKAPFVKSPKPNAPLPPSGSSPGNPNPSNSNSGSSWSSSASSSNSNQSQAQKSSGPKKPVKKLSKVSDWDKYDTKPGVDLVDFGDDDIDEVDSTYKIIKAHFARGKAKGRPSGAEFIAGNDSEALNPLLSNGSWGKSAINLLAGYGYNSQIDAKIQAVSYLFGGPITAQDGLDILPAPNYVVAGETFTDVNPDYPVPDGYKIQESSNGDTVLVRVSDEVVIGRYVPNEDPNSASLYMLHLNNPEDISEGDITAFLDFAEAHANQSNQSNVPFASRDITYITHGIATSNEGARNAFTNAASVMGNNTIAIGIDWNTPVGLEPISNFSAASANLDSTALDLANLFNQGDTRTSGRKFVVAHSLGTALVLKAFQDTTDIYIDGMLFIQGAADSREVQPVGSLNAIFQPHRVGQVIVTHTVGDPLPGLGDIALWGEETFFVVAGIGRLPLGYTIEPVSILTPDGSLRVEFLPTQTYNVNDYPWLQEEYIDSAADPSSVDHFGPDIGNYGGVLCQLYQEMTGLAYCP